MSGNRRDHHPVADFFKGLFLGTLTSFSGIIVTFMGIGLFSFPVAAGVVVAIPLLIGIYFWIVSKRKFFALGFFMSLPIVFFIFYSICGTLFLDGI
ncbi:MULTISPECIES: hypothetical protein [unclassified Bacillus (in: firmicutes)]|uniref:hypothetical protein n=1 Tax=unclassified Bacillus (in: firmicutes) TaxID=185979 RepID=UPI000BEFCFDC|nr:MULTISPECIES: hypothetical protein [unclassified Bacillus (in: firmicutes)]PEJ58479.1 hypothetical protein CN692_09415 [Bacillus sp. AFS002410]PEL12946.1 hypothetical protein CN601_06685 [Bacillus sp. AFS017336]